MHSQYTFEAISWSIQSSVKHGWPSLDGKKERKENTLGRSVQKSHLCSEESSKSHTTISRHVVSHVRMRLRHQNKRGEIVDEM